MSDSIKTSQRLRQAHLACKKLFPAFHEDVQSYVHLVKAVMRSNSIPVLEALIKISQTEAYNSSPKSKLMFAAACVEIIESAKNAEEPHTAGDDAGNNK